MILLIDNYDSFTYNLYQYLCELGAEVTVKRNDTISLGEVKELEPQGIIVSPGPGGPGDAGISTNVIRDFGARIPILGVCLGHQCIGQAYGGTVTRAEEIMHGKSSSIHHDNKGIFSNLPNPFEAIRYHSLIVVPDSIPDSLEVSAWTENGIVMGLRHKEHPVEGVQFHPESILTQGGKDLLSNWLQKVYKYPND